MVQDGGPGSARRRRLLFRWAVDRLPYFALPRYLELREALPTSPLGRVRKRQLRDEGVTSTTWDVEASDVTYERG